MPWKDARLDDFGQGGRDRGAGHSDSNLAESRATSRSGWWPGAQWRRWHFRLVIKRVRVLALWGCSSSLVKFKSKYLPGRARNGHSVCQAPSTVPGTQQVLDGGQPAVGAVVLGGGGGTGAGVVAGVETGTLCAFSSYFNMAILGNQRALGYNEGALSKP